MDKLVLDIGNANLVVQKDDGEYDAFVICLEEKETGIVTQDIVIVRLSGEKNESKSAAVECLVYSDHYSEDYTHSFLIKQYVEDE